MIKDFYPTPPALIKHMLATVNFDRIDCTDILEPSAGKGDICEYIRKSTEYRSTRQPVQIDTIEIDPELQLIIKGKGFRLIHDDFLTFETHKRYDLIIANFPFSEGDRHLEAAFGLLNKTGGRLICLVNAETLHNPFTRLRTAILAELDHHHAKVEFLENQFVDAERPTGVEVALIDVTVERSNGPSIILDSLETAAKFEGGARAQDDVVEVDFMKALVSRFMYECQVGIHLIQEYAALQPVLTNKIKRKGDEGRFTKPLIKLEIEDAHINGSDKVAEQVNAYLVGVRTKYWEILIHDPRFNGMYTSNVLTTLSDKLKELKNYDFNLFNIQELIKEMNSKITAGIEAAILSLFEQCSRKHSWGEGVHEGNIHYYNGWKTNVAHRINHRVILPVNGFSSYGYRGNRLDYRVHETLRDMVKVFNYLAPTPTDVPQLVGAAISVAEANDNFNNIDLSYFRIKLFKKGTCHITFTNLDLLAKFNIFGSQRKGWLPPHYGRERYENLDAEAKSVIDSFQGREAYEEVVRDPDFYLVDPAKLLAAGAAPEEPDHADG